MNPILSTNGVLNAAAVFDAVNDYESRTINSLVVNGVVWFCGKDIAEILEYKRTDQALRMHVKERNKATFEGIVDPLSQGVPKLHPNQLTKIYINEPGLYGLIMKSKQKVAERFQDWVTDDLLPTLRKQGSYHMEREYIERTRALEEEKTQALLKASKAEQMYLAEQEAKQQAEEALKKAQQRELRLSEFIKTTAKLERKEILYIGTSDVYQRQHRFKVGGVASEDSLTNRFSSYNSGRPAGDQFFCARFWRVHSYSVLEKITKAFLVHFKDNQSKSSEDYHIHGNSLVEALEFVVQNDGESVEWFNEHFEAFTKNTIDAEPSALLPIELKKKLIISAGDTKVEIADITHWPQEQIDAEISAILDIYKQRKGLNDLADHQGLWSELAAIIRERHKNALIRPWRSLFKENLLRRSERLRLKGLGM